MYQNDTSPPSSPKYILGLNLVSVEEQRAIWDREKKDAEERRVLEEENATILQRGFSSKGDSIPINKGQTLSPTSQLNNLLQQCEIEKNLQIVESFFSGFSATLDLGSERFTAAGPYKSKKAARNAVAQLGVDYLKKLPLPMKETLSLSPVLEASSTLTTYVAQLQILAQKHGVPLPDYTGIKEVQPQIFTGSVSIANHTFEAPGPFRSKKEAKEAVAQLGLQIMEIYEKAGNYDVEKGLATNGASILNGKLRLKSVHCFQSDFSCI
jgi:hypothetical protein